MKKILFLYPLFLILLVTGCGKAHTTKSNLSNLPDTDALQSDQAQDSSGINDENETNSNGVTGKKGNLNNAAKGHNVACKLSEVKVVSFKTDPERGGMMTVGYTLLLHTTNDHCFIPMENLTLLGVSDTDKTYKIIVPNAPKELNFDSKLNAKLNMTFMRQDNQDQDPTNCKTISNFIVKYNGNILIKTNEDSTICGNKAFIED